MVTIKKDKKGACYVISHKRCEITVAEFFTLEELIEIKRLIEEILNDN